MYHDDSPNQQELPRVQDAACYLFVFCFVLGKCLQFLLFIEPLTSLKIASVVIQVKKKKAPVAIVFVDA